MQNELRTSKVDDDVVEWLSFQQPVSAVNGDQLNITVQGRGKITWDVYQAMVVVGCRQDGWLIEVIDGEYFSVPYGSIQRPDEIR